MSAARAEPSSADNNNNNNSNSQPGSQAGKRTLDLPSQIHSTPFLLTKCSLFFLSLAVLKKAKADADIAALPIAIVITIIIIIAS